MATLHASPEQAQEQLAKEVKDQMAAIATESKVANEVADVSGNESAKTPSVNSGAGVAGSSSSGSGSSTHGGSKKKKKAKSKKTGSFSAIAADTATAPAKAKPPELSEDEKRWLSLYEMEQHLSPDMKKSMLAQHVNERVAAMEADVAKQLQAAGEDQVSKLSSILHTRTVQLAKTSSELDSTKGRVVSLIQSHREATEGWRNEINRCEKLTALCKMLEAKYNHLREKNEGMIRDQQRVNEVQARFSGAVQEMSDKLETLTKDRIAGLEENERLKQQLGKVLKLDSMRKEHSEHEAKAQKLQIQLLEAKLKQAEGLTQMEQEKNKKLAKQLLKSDAHAAALGQKLKGYDERFGEVKQTLQDSSNLFTKVRKENASLKDTALAGVRKQAELEKALVQSVDERNKEKELLLKTTRQKVQLEALCKTLTAQQQKLKAELQALKGEEVKTEASAAVAAASNQDNAALDTASKQDLVPAAESVDAAPDNSLMEPQQQ